MFDLVTAPAVPYLFFIGPVLSMANRAHLYLLIVIAVFFPACMKSEPNAPSSREELIRKDVPPAILVVFAQEPDPKSSTLTLQDYHRDGRSFIPIFRSKDSFQQSTRGGVNKPIFQIDRKLFISMLHGAETVILDVGLPGEIITNAEELKRIFSDSLDRSRSIPSQ